MEVLGSLTIWKTLREKEKRHARHPKDFTVRAVAKKLNMGYGNLSDLENGKQWPTAVTLAKLVKFYSLSPVDVYMYLEAIRIEQEYFEAEQRKGKE